ncbi:L-threonylcarbamoyladenylate synthase [Gloeocapsa sp. PCC 73106]|uniref:L-threonylcarbamoyladenylate synthase n=1 Tax=Gloeocapsa sp. PCC 73106 TaxID=102232 RepID=UPI0002AD1B20|nr:L-threonylcarbamoyladenylate synthase [Gloeocapsa sp. PCC 73106]ELR99497.1 putative translation factor (SUA5) [Gloeocapsa sp. PCC 73106]
MTKVSETELITTAQAGNIVCFPTDTLPALGVLPSRAQQIFTLKQRPLNKPLILMAASALELWQFVEGTPQEILIWQATAQKYWPGALTLILPASAHLNRAINPTDPTSVGLRIPNHPFARAILTQTGPLATTSANLSGEPPLETLAEIELKFPQVFTLDWGENEKKMGSGLPSTVARWREQNWEILRQGSVNILDFSHP